MKNISIYEYLPSSVGPESTDKSKSRFLRVWRSGAGEKPRFPQHVAAEAAALVVLFEVHAGVHAGYLVAVAVEHQGGDGAGEEAGVDAAFAGLGPAGVVVVGVDVEVEAVLHAVGVVPGGGGLLVGEVETDDGFADLKPYFQGTMTRMERRSGWGGSGRSSRR